MRGRNEGCFDIDITCRRRRCMRMIPWCYGLIVIWLLFCRHPSLISSFQFNSEKRTSVETQKDKKKKGKSKLETLTLSSEWTIFCDQAQIRWVSGITESSEFDFCFGNDAFFRFFCWPREAIDARFGFAKKERSTTDFPSTRTLDVLSRILNFRLTRSSRCLWLAVPVEDHPYAPLPLTQTQRC